MDKKILVIVITLTVLSACTGKPSEQIISAGVVDGDVITVKAAVSGKVETLNIAEGASVSKNSLLVAVDTDKIKNQLV